MTNENIIMEQRINLMKAGKIGTTGRTMEITDGFGRKINLPEPEAIHTFAHWKSLGFKVIKGQKAIAKFPIWKYTTKKVQNEETGEEEQKSSMFMKAACFFSASQVEAI
jgi:hypothetical protein